MRSSVPKFACKGPDLTDESILLIRPVEIRLALGSVLDNLMRNKETIRDQRGLSIRCLKADSSQKKTYVMSWASNLTDPGLQSTHRV